KGEESRRIPAEAGANRFIWNYRYAGPTPLEDDTKKGNRAAQRMEEGIPPRALPGEYTVRLTMGETTVSEKLTLLPDPRLPATDADRRAQFELKLAIRDLVNELHQGVNQVRRLRKQVEGWEERTKGREGAERLNEAASALKEQLTAAERALINLDLDTPQPGPNRLKEKLATLGAMSEESDDAPTQGAREVLALLREQTQAELEKLRGLVAGDVAAFNEQVRASDIPPVGA
ncbi:MAG TPA: hypothetical protein VKT52_03040, partial [Ktedonobacterales bacterium]|nr:hypothetical protein [Ktedonobacterales bacterium]